MPRLLLPRSGVSCCSTSCHRENSSTTSPRPVVSPSPHPHRYHMHSSSGKGGPCLTHGSCSSVVPAAHLQPLDRSDATTFPFARPEIPGHVSHLFPHRHPLSFPHDQNPAAAPQYHRIIISSYCPLSSSLSLLPTLTFAFRLLPLPSSFAVPPPAPPRQLPPTLTIQSTTPFNDACIPPFTSSLSVDGGKRYATRASRCVVRVLREGWPFAKVGIDA